MLTYVLLFFNRCSLLWNKICLPSPFVDCMLLVEYLIILVIYIGCTIGHFALFEILNRIIPFLLKGLPCLLGIISSVHKYHNDILYLVVFGYATLGIRGVMGITGDKVWSESYSLYHGELLMFEVLVRDGSWV